MAKDTRIVRGELLQIKCDWCEDECVLTFTDEDALGEFLDTEASDWCCSSECRKAVEHPVNQCDGCRRGMPIRDGVHYNPDGSYDYIACTAEDYPCSPAK